MSLERQKHRIEKTGLKDSSVMYARVSVDKVPSPAALSVLKDDHFARRQPHPLDHRMAISLWLAPPTMTVD
jgi:hypothetical protein